MIWGISCLHFCKKSADHNEGNTCSEVPIDKLLTMRCGGGIVVNIVAFYCGNPDSSPTEVFFCWAVQKDLK